MVRWVDRNQIQKSTLTLNHYLCKEELIGQGHDLYILNYDSYLLNFFKRASNFGEAKGLEFTHVTLEEVRFTKYPKHSRLFPPMMGNSGCQLDWLRNV